MSKLQEYTITKSHKGKSFDMNVKMTEKMAQSKEYAKYKPRLLKKSSKPKDESGDKPDEQKSVDELKADLLKFGYTEEDFKDKKKPDLQALLAEQRLNNLKA